MKQRSLGLIGLSLLSLAAAFTPARPVAACGGCFHSSMEANPSMVVGHRMALSISAQRTVLWDQVKYTGSPEDFAWVLPVGPGAVLELSNDAWFESLEAVTATRVMSRAVVCDNGQTIQQVDSGGCGSSTAPSNLAGGETDPEATRRQGDDPNVAVTHQATVGPYETVTLKAGDAVSLQNWLKNHSYVIPADIAPVLQAYVDEGSEFLALRLAPGNGVSQMQPVRVVTPGASPVLPLRMVAAGTGASVSLVLYVVGEGRYKTQNFPETLVSPASLAWDWTAQQSNYSELRDAALSAGAGDAWLTSFSRAAALTTKITAADGQLATYAAGSGSYDNLADLYFAQAAENDGALTPCSVGSNAASKSVVLEACAMAGCSGGQIEASALACDGYDDLAAATIGLHPADVWVTRLEAELPREALAKDLVLGAHMAQDEIGNWHVAQKDLNDPPCPKTAPQDDTQNASVDSGGSGGFCSFAPGRKISVGAAGIFALAAWFAARRLRRRQLA
jgi:hypothetical protein